MKCLRHIVIDLRHLSRGETEEAKRKEIKREKEEAVKKIATSNKRDNSM